MDDNFQSQMKETTYCDMMLKSWKMEIREEATIAMQYLGKMIPQQCISTQQ
jgi:hypothetical protein